MANGGRATPHENQAVGNRKKVFFTANAKILQGMGVCYDVDRGTVADADVHRSNFVEVPTTSNNRHFAGVACQTYAAKTDGRWIDIWEPGSYCLIACGGQDPTVGVTRLTCAAGGPVPGRFDNDGLPGRGTMLALQTADIVRVAESDDGGGAMVSQALTETASFVGAVVDDHVVVRGGGDDDGTASILPGLHPITVVTSDNVVTVSTTAVDGENVSFYTMVGENPLCFGYLEDGEESGLQEWVNPVESTAVQHMVGGMTHIGGGGMTLGADCTSTLADPTIVGELKAFFCHGAMTTNDYVVTVTSGLVLAGTALANLNFNAVSENSLLMGGSTIWRSIAGEGTVEA